MGVQFTRRLFCNCIWEFAYYYIFFFLIFLVLLSNRVIMYGETD